jgi:serine protease Do
MKSMGSFFKALLLATAFVAVQVKADTDVLRQAKVMTEAGRFKEAVSLLKTYVPQDRNEELATHLIAGKIYLALDRSDRALEYFEQAYEQEMDNFEAVIGAATASVKLGHFKQARQYLRMASDITSGSAEPVFLQAMIALRTGDVKNAHALMSALTKQQPDSAQAAIANARFLSQSGDNQGAVRVLKEFVARHPKLAPSLDYLGELEFRFGNQATGLQQKQAAYLLYDKEANTFKRDVVAAWLEVNGGLPSQPQKPPAVSNQHIPKEVMPAEPVIEKPPANLVDKQVKQAKANGMPSANDKDFSPPLLRFPFPDGVAITGGSGFVVDSGKKIVTNRHVIEGGKAFAIRTGLGEVIKANLIYTSASDDLAVLELDKPLPADRSIPPNAYSKPRVGRNVVVMGYPLWFILGQGSPSLTNGMVSKRTGMGDDQGTFQLTAKVNRGNSGGPVFDMAGNVVGITVGKLDTKKIQEEQGFVPEDVNFAIHVDRLPALINASFDAKSPNTTELTTEELYQVMLGKVVMVATYK